MIHGVQEAFMIFAAYVAASQARLQLRPGDLEEIGIRVTGPVLRGETTVRERQLDQDGRLDQFRQELRVLADWGRVRP